MNGRYRSVCSIWGPGNLSGTTRSDFHFLRWLNNSCVPRNGNGSLCKHSRLICERELYFRASNLCSRVGERPEFGRTRPSPNVACFNQLESTVRIRCIGLLLISFSIASAVGCSNGQGSPPPASQPSPEPTPPAKPQPAPEATPEPEPEIEPVPGEAVRLTLPADYGEWPWTVGKSVESPESKTVSFYGVAPYAVTGFAVRPEANRAVISIKADSKKVDPRKPPTQSGAFTRIALCNIATGKILNEWLIPGHYAVLDLSPDGRGYLPPPRNREGSATCCECGLPGRTGS